jgi:hypothetical protein
MPGRIEGSRKEGFKNLSLEAEFNTNSYFYAPHLFNLNPEKK